MVEYLVPWQTEVPVSAPAIIICMCISVYCVYAVKYSIIVNNTIALSDIIHAYTVHR